MNLPLGKMGLILSQLASCGKEDSTDALDERRRKLGLHGTIHHT